MPGASPATGRFPLAKVALQGIAGITISVPKAGIFSLSLRPPQACGGVCWAAPVHLEAEGNRWTQPSEDEAVSPVMPIVSLSKGQMAARTRNVGATPPLC